MTLTFHKATVAVLPIMVIGYLWPTAAGTEADTPSFAIHATNRATEVVQKPHLNKREPANPEKSMDQVPIECDAAAGRLDDAVIETRKMEGAYLIIIARLGTGEPSSLNQIRLANVQEYVLRRGSDLKYVLAEGRRVKGLGRMELYVGGRLSRLMPFEKNAKGYCIPRREGW